MREVAVDVSPSHQRLDDGERKVCMYTDGEGEEIDEIDE
jgi:hypothetical protein